MAVYFFFVASFAHLVSLTAGEGAGQESQPVPMGFPAAWDGDKYFNYPCPVSPSIPAWLDGYFFCQSCGSYGKQSDPAGQRLIHMFDGIGAVAMFHLGAGEVQFSAKYYPTRPYKIWDFNGRDLTRSMVAWETPFSPYNLSAADQWRTQTRNLFPFAPNVDFWKVGHSIIGGTETTHVGLTFDVSSLDHFQMYPFKETSNIFTYQNETLPISMPIHERVDADGLVWAVTSAANFQTGESFHIVFSVTPAGVRTVEGMYSYGFFDLGKCTKDGKYGGDKRALAGYMHSITSTTNYIILPVTSSLMNPCALAASKTPQPGPDGLTRHNFGGYAFDSDNPVRFVVFDKRTKTFATKVPTYSPGLFISHQLNAFETSDGKIIADMIAYSTDAYETLFVDNLAGASLSETLPNGQVYRFTLDLEAGTASSSFLLPSDTLVEFPQINHAYDDKQYTYAYALANPYATGSYIIKMNVNDPSKNINFRPPTFNISLGEPSFVPTPGATAEDDGVLLIKGLDPDASRAVLYVVDAKTMTLLGQAPAPTIVPFGFHNRYYSAADLGLPPTPTFMPTTSTPESGLTITLTPMSLFILIVVLIVGARMIAR